VAKTTGRRKTKPKAKKKGPELPAFRNDEEARRFWDTHNVADYWDQLRPIRAQASKQLRERVKERAKLRKSG